MNAAQLNQTFDLVGYAGSIVQLHKSGAYYIGPCPICGGRDRFNIRRFSDGDEWICRRHVTDNKYHSPIDFYMDYKKVNFTEAIKEMGGELSRPERQERREWAQPKPVTPAQDWQAQAWQYVFAAADRLTREPEGERGRRYLLGRGISKGSMCSFWLGYVPTVHLWEAEDKPAKTIERGAIVIPYFDSGKMDPDAGNIIAIKYRFVVPSAPIRFVMQRGSKPLLFGLNQVIGNETTLLICEGELNAVSVVQCRPQGIATVSIGGDTNGGAILRTFAAQYRRVVIWMDEQEKAQELRAKIGRSDATLIKSPVIEGIKRDANRLLTDGVLLAFLAAKFSTACQGVPVDTDVINYMQAGESGRAII